MRLLANGYSGNFLILQARTGQPAQIIVAVPGGGAARAGGALYPASFLVLPLLTLLLIGPNLTPPEEARHAPSGAVEKYMQSQRHPLSHRISRLPLSAA